MVWSGRRKTRSVPRGISVFNSRVSFSIKRLSKIAPKNNECLHIIIDKLVVDTDTALPDLIDQDSDHDSIFDGPSTPARPPAPSISSPPSTETSMDIPIDSDIEFEQLEHRLFRNTKVVTESETAPLSSYGAHSSNDPFDFCLVGGVSIGGMLQAADDYYKKVLGKPMIVLVNPNEHDCPRRPE